MARKKRRPRKPPVVPGIEGTAIGPPSIDGLKNAREFRRLVSEAQSLTAISTGRILEIYGQMYDTNQNVAVPIEAILEALGRDLEKLVVTEGAQAAEALVARNAASSAARTAGSLSKISPALAQGAKIETGAVATARTASTKNTKNLVRSLLGDYRSSYEEVVNRAVMTGADPRTISTNILKEQRGLGRKTRKRANLIATDQSRKGFTSMNAARMKGSGIRKFVWKHSGAGEPRPFHIANHPAGLNGGVYDLDNPPIIDPKTGERGLPGQLIGCKCTMIPVLDFGDGDQEAEAERTRERATR